jgi:L-ascorbate metabolism protein UlaG (beta-lactamase superfamily)
VAKRLIMMTAALLAAPLFLFVLLWALFSWRPDSSGWPQWPASDSAEAGALSVTWLGTSTLLISDGVTDLMTDAYFSRASRLSVMTQDLAPDDERIDAMLRQYQIDGLDAVLVVHSHFDHAMDSPAVAMRTGAELVGSESTANVGRGAGMAESAIRVVVPGEAMRYADFEVIFLLSDHVPQAAWLDRLTGMNEPISEPLSPPAPVSAWKEGESYALLIRHPQGNILIQGSAGFVDGQLDGYQADLAFVSSVGLSRQRDGYVADYVRNTVTASGAPKVVPIHWDDFFLPWQAENTPAMPLIMEDLEGSFRLLSDEVGAAGAEFVVLPPGQTIYLRKDEQHP